MLSINIVVLEAVAENTPCLVISEGKGMALEKQIGSLVEGQGLGVLVAP